MRTHYTEEMMELIIEQERTLITAIVEQSSTSHHAPHLWEETDADSNDGDLVFARSTQFYI